MSLRERLAFLRQFRREFEATGAVQPSSRWLGRAMARPLRQAAAAAAGESRRIAEMGPGTGAVTRALAAAMGPRDRLDCWEINAEFADWLAGAVARDPAYAGVRERIRVHHAPAQEAPGEADVDFVVCSVPLNNLPAAAVEEIFAAGERLLRPEGTFTYFEYPVLPDLKAMLSSAAERARIRQVDGIKRRFRAGRVRGTRIVPWNIPPARVWHLARDAS